MFTITPFARRSLVDYFDDIEREFFKDFNANNRTMKTDIIEKETEFIIEAEVPGFDKSDISIDINGKYLTIKAEKKEESENNESNYIYKERSYGSFTRTFDISKVNVEAIKASHNNGILTVTLPKLEEIIPKVKTIEIE